jgi:hypothetical protein
MEPRTMKTFPEVETPICNGPSRCVERSENVQFIGESAQLTGILNRLHNEEIQFTAISGAHSAGTYRSYSGVIKSQIPCLPRHPLPVVRTSSDLPLEIRVGHDVLISSRSNPSSRNVIAQYLWEIRANMSPQLRAIELPV